MKRLQLLRPIVFVGLALLTVVASSQPAFAATAATTATKSAATNGNGNGLRVAPVRNDITINPGASQTIYITVNNISIVDASYQIVVNDFVANANETGQPTLILDPKQFAPTHSLKRFVQQAPNFTLHSGEQKSIPIVITVPKNAAGGGYYGTIRFAPAAADGTSNDQTVNLAGSVGSLVLLKVPGQIKDLMSLSSFDIRTEDRPSSFFTSNKNLVAVVRFQNEGNIQEQPFGKITIRNRSGRTVGTYEINNVTPKGNVLPQSIRRFTIPLDKVGRFGQFKLEGNFGYGTGGQLLSASTTFYVIPYFLIITFIGIVILLALLVFVVPRLLRTYNQRVIAAARRRR
jgi:hypothetical protein